METDGSIVVRLHFEGADLDPGAITNLLGKSPTVTQAAGDEIGHQRKRAASGGRWMLESSRATFTEANRLIEELFRGATLDLDTWRETASAHGGFLEIAVRTPELNNTLDLSHTTLRAIVDRTLGLSIDVWNEKPSAE